MFTRKNSNIIIDNKKQTHTSLHTQNQQLVTEQETFLTEFLPEYKQKKILKEFKEFIYNIGFASSAEIELASGKFQKQYSNKSDITIRVVGCSKKKNFTTR